MHSVKSEPKCPNCGGVLIYLDQYQSYYCPLCNEHFEIMAQQRADKVPKEPPKGAAPVKREKPKEEAPVEKESDPLFAQIPRDTDSYAPLEPDEEHHKEPATLPSIEDDILKEDKEDIPGGQVGDLLEEKPKRKRKFKNYRYRTRMLKGSILPILFGIISFQMINSSRMQFPDYYKLEPMMILLGFVLGFITISSITIMNMIKAKKDVVKGYPLNMKVGIAAYLPFIVIFMGLSLFVDLSSGWKFATGFFLASIFPIIFIAAFEATSRGKFFVKEALDDPSWGRKLIFKR